MRVYQGQKGHIWETLEDGDIDVFQYSHGYHNGPRCVNCGISFCQHCTEEKDLEECTVNLVQEKK